MFGEIGALYNIPQPSTFSTTKVSQLLRVNTKVFKNIMEENKDDEQIVLKIKDSLHIINAHVITQNTPEHTKIRQSNTPKQAGYDTS